MKNSDITIFDRDTLIHLRLPFSFFLFPVFLFGISQATSITPFDSLIVFIVLHFFIYPASNIYNSFNDEDKGSIGLLENPPPVTPKLYYASIFFDVTGLLLCLLAGYQLMLLMIIYISVSKAYSWKKIRLKKYAVSGWIIVMLFQGGYTYLLVNMSAENNFSLTWFTLKNNLAMLLASILIGAYYPLTQIYQHKEDSERGDRTISYLLGVRGTFVFTIILFALATTLAWYYFISFYTLKHFYIFCSSLLPVVFYFFWWMKKVWQDEQQANFKNAMRMTFISSCFLIICYGCLLYLNHKSG